MTDTIEAPEVKTPTKRTLLESWSKLLESIDTERKGRVTPQVANRTLSAWPKLDYSDLDAYYQRYYDISDEMRQVVEHEVATHPEALKNIEDDGEDNEEIYLNIMFGWQQVIILHEHNWDTNAPDAAIELAAIADVQTFYLGQTGMVAHLGDPNLGFSFSDEDSDALRLALQEWKDAL